MDFKQLDFLQCPDCNGEIKTKQNQLSCLSCNRRFDIEDGVTIALPSEMNKLSQEEAEYHDDFTEDDTQVHQLDSYRNIFYHKKIWREVNHLPQNSRVLEIGCGSGFDAQHISEHINLILSDISKETLKSTKQKLGQGNTYIAADGLTLPYQDEVFDGVFLSATFHHFVENYTKAKQEIHRVTQPEGIVVLGVEPNSFYFRKIKKFRSFLCRVVGMDPQSGSQADAQMTGFSYHKIKTMFTQEKWEILEIKPMWFLAGFLHYGLEFVYRKFNLNQRITLPIFLEKLIIYIDELLFNLPGFSHLCWHWIIKIKKKG